MYNRLLKVIVSSLLLIPGLAYPQDIPTIDVSDVGEEPQQLVGSDTARPKPYEIVITPTMTRVHLRGLIETVEEDFFARFNELNIDKNYDIVCYKHTPTMTHIRERVCEPLFLIRARGENASGTTFLLGSGGKDAISQTQGAANSVAPDVMKLDKKNEFEILQLKMEELNRSDDELRSIGSVLAQLKSRLKNFGKDD